MKPNWKRIALVASILALSAIVVFAGAAFAMGKGPGGNQDATAPATSGLNAPADNYALGVRGAWGGADNSLVSTVAAALDMEQADLLVELDGSSLADVIAAHGGDAEAIVDATLAPRADWLAPLVADGRLTEEQVDTMLADMADSMLAEMAQPWDGMVAGNGYQGSSDGFGGYRNSAAGASTAGASATDQSWIDNDGDGVCDNYDGVPQQTGQSTQRGARGGRWSR